MSDQETIQHLQDELDRTQQALDAYVADCLGQNKEIERLRAELGKEHEYGANQWTRAQVAERRIAELEDVRDAARKVPLSGTIPECDCEDCMAIKELHKRIAATEQGESDERS